MLFVGGAITPSFERFVGKTENVHGKCVGWVTFWKWSEN